ncbi:pyruvate dehydrogenase, putative [Babesia ovata]|uniref:Pyruvate dehydrogenase, putative n=1 Tax=Babesia ovata TaxID=189622 RepID=A0A2H6KB47_9APIC|nr:pyruvate dehydrogenase, putative [Babesia ovata]GBE60223.1 pyruvate dehydrogenase, putative [Babesia ovata]
MSVRKFRQRSNPYVLCIILKRTSKCDFSWLPFGTTWCSAVRIIPPNVLLKQILKVFGELIFDLIVRFFEFIHEFITKLNWTTRFITNLPSRLPDRRLGRSLDLLFGGLVESVNGGGKFFDLSLKWLFDMVIKIIYKVVIYLLPHRLQLTVHGFGGAFLVGGALFGVSSRGKLAVKIVRCLVHRVQDARDAVFCFAGKQHRLQFVAHLAGHGGDCAEYGGDESLFLAVLLMDTPLAVTVCAAYALADAFCGVEIVILHLLLDLGVYSTELITVQLLVKRFGERITALFHSVDVSMNLLGAAARSFVSVYNLFTGFS